MVFNFPRKFIFSKDYEEFIKDSHGSIAKVTTYGHGFCYITIDKHANEELRNFLKLKYGQYLLD